MAWTLDRRYGDQRWYDLKCGHRQFGQPGLSWDGVICLNCGAETRVVAQQGPAVLEDLFRF